MSDIKLESKEIEFKILYSEEFSINPEDLKFIFCDGKQCDPTICLRTSCKVFEYWRNKKE